MYTIMFLCGHRARAEDFCYVVTLNLSTLVSYVAQLCDLSVVQQQACINGEQIPHVSIELILYNARWLEVASNMICGEVKN